MLYILSIATAIAPTMALSASTDTQNTNFLNVSDTMELSAALENSNFESLSLDELEYIHEREERIQEALDNSNYDLSDSTAATLLALRAKRIWLQSIYFTKPRCQEDQECHAIKRGIMRVVNLHMDVIASNFILLVILPALKAKKWVVETFRKVIGDNPKRFALLLYGSMFGAYGIFKFRDYVDHLRNLPESEKQMTISSLDIRINLLTSEVTEEDYETLRNLDPEGFDRVMLMIEDLEKKFADVSVSE